MPEIYISLRDAADFEGLKYTGFVSRIQRDPEAYKTAEAPGENGGRPRVTVALSSLSPKARRAYRASLKIPGGDLIIENKTDRAPWYVDADLNWYLENHYKSYEVASVLVKEIEAFIAYSAAERTAYAGKTARQLGLSERTLYRHAEAVTTAGAWALRMEKETGHSYTHFKILALCRKPRDGQAFPSITPPMRALIENIWFDKSFAENHGTVEMLYRKFQAVARDREWEEIPSYPTVCRYINHLMESRGGRSARRMAEDGLREWKNTQMLKGKRDLTSLAVMEFLMGDAHTFDLWVTHTASNGKVRPVRPTLVAWIDLRSRMIFGDVVCVHPNAQTIKESIVKTAYSVPGGIPKNLLVDNGKDFTAEANIGQSRKDRTMQEICMDSEVKGFFRSVGIEVWHRALPYQPWTKAEIERFFGTVCQSFSKWFASYTGTLTGSKTSGKRNKDIKRMFERGELLTMEEFFKCWTEWKETVYQMKPHGGLRSANEKHITPAALFEHCENRYAKAPPPREFTAMLLMRGDTALVRQQGIQKFGVLYTDYELAHYVGQKVNIKWDMDNVTKLYVYSLKGEKICEAVSAELLSFGEHVSQKQLEGHLRNQKRQQKEIQELLHELRAPYETRVEEGATPETVGAVDLMIRAARPEKVITLPRDKEFRGASTHSGTGRKAESSYLNRRGKDALQKLRSLG
ncbi:Mu transposase C-terminal domain-containing protein [Oscillospiraceae bacterium OttesenSCG-928-F05]|nr:Mu transposase C-terminal domain-containing protein [Oscillospiraceae bacterium OttesenSCG-928-F05]